MDLRSLAQWVPGSHFLSEFKAQGRCTLPGHTDDSDQSLLLKQNGDRVSVGCYAGLGHTTDAILTAWGLTRSDLIVSRPPPSNHPEFRTEPPADGFSANGAGHTSDREEEPPEGKPESNGKPHPPSLQAWMILVFRIAKHLLEHDAGQSPEFLASATPEILFDGVMKNLRRGVDAGQLNPLPELNLTELDEQLQIVAREAVKDFSAAHMKKAAADSPPEEEPEEKISSLHLDQLYDMIDQWDRQPWVWEGILPHSSLSLIVGKSETGKSTLVYSLIYAIVTGTEFFGRQCERGRVVYLAGDPMSEVVAGKTFRALGLEDGVVVVPEALVMFPTGMEQLRGLVQEFKPSLIVGDTLAATVNLDTDKYGESYRAQMPLTRMAREFGPNILLSHHSQKSAIDSYSVIDAALGSVGVAAVASSRMSTKLYRRKGNKYYTFEMSNLRIGNPLEGEFIIHKLENGQVELGGLWKVQNTEMDKQAIVDVLSRQTKPLAKRTLWQELRPKPKWDPFNDAIEELLAAGKIIIEEGPRSGKLFKLRSD